MTCIPLSRDLFPLVDHGYFRSTHYPNERTRNASFEMSMGSGTYFTPQMQPKVSDTQLPQTPLTENWVVGTVIGADPSYTLPGVTPSQAIMGTFENTERKITPGLGHYITNMSSNVYTQLSFNET